MSQNRDASDEVAAAIVGTIAGCLGGLFLGRWWQQRQKQMEQSRRLVMSGTLELPDNVSYKVKEPNPLFKKPKWREDAATLTVVGLGFLTLMAFAYGWVLLTEEPGVLAKLGGLIGLVISIPLAKSTYRRGRKLYQDQAERKKAQQQRVLHEDASEIPPLNLTFARSYLVRLPKSTAWDPVTATRFMQQMLQKFSRLTFQIVAEPEQISWRVLDLRYGFEGAMVQQAIRSFYPEAEIIEGEVAPDTYDTPFYRYLMGLSQPGEPLFPLKYAQELKVDPLVQLTQEMSELRQGERIIYTLYVADQARFVFDQIKRILTVQPGMNPFQFLTPEGWLAAGLSVTNRDLQRIEAFEPEMQQVVEAKVKNIIYQCLLLLEIQAPSADRVRDLCSLYTQFSGFANFPYGVITWDDDDFPETIEVVDTPEKAANDTFARLSAWLTNQSLSWREFRLLLDTHELSALWHLPHEKFSSPRITWASKNQPLPHKMRGVTGGTCLGENRSADKVEPVSIPDVDRATHINILGMTGVGKSTFMYQMITQDISRGLGVAVVDPHGHLIEDLLQTGIPKGREADVVLLDLANADYPPPLNPLVAGGNQAATARIISVLEKIYGRTDNAPRMANALSSALMTLRCQPQATVRDIAMLFLDADYRKRLLETVDDEVALEFWNYEYEAATPGQQQQIREPVLYRVRTFYRNSHLYPIICHPYGLDFQGLISDKKIILLSLGMDEELIPESERNLVGALVVSQLQMAAMKQTNQLSPIHLYIDEVQNFVTTSLDEVFSEARKFGLSLTVANQYLKQLTGETLEAIMGNVGAMVVFQCGLDDARRLAPYMSPGFSADDLLNLDKYEAVVKMRFEGQTQPAFSLKTRKPATLDTLPEVEKAEALERAARIKEASARQYTPLSRSEVMEWLSARYPKTRNTAMADAGHFYEE